jgi:hypothetical protein
MEISANGAVNAFLEQKQAQTMQQVQVTVLKKAMDMSSQSALGLINAISNPPSPSALQGVNSSLGSNIDIRV